MDIVQGCSQWGWGSRGLKPLPHMPSPLEPPPCNDILYRGLWKAAILSPGQPPLSHPCHPEGQPSWAHQMKWHRIGESWRMANDGEWRTGQYLVEGAKAIKCFHPMLTPLMARVNTNSMELSYHSLSWYLQKSHFEKYEFFWVMQLIRYRPSFVNHLLVEISVLYLQ